MRGIRRLVMFALCAAVAAGVLGLRVLAFGPGSEFTVSQIFPLAVENAQSMILNTAGTEGAPAPQPVPGDLESALADAQEAGAEDAGTSGAAEEILIVGDGSLAVGESITLTAVVLPEEAGETEVSWYSLDESVAVVSEDGVVTALAAGQAEIRARARDGSGAEGAHLVRAHLPEAEAVTNVPASLRLGVGQTEALRWTVLPVYASQQVSIKTSKNNIATVTEDGSIRALKTGSCTVTVITPNGKSQKCKVTVVKAPRSLALEEREISLGIDAAQELCETRQLRPRIAASAAAGFEYASSDASVVSVSESGLLTAEGSGDAVVTVTTHNGLEASCAVSVRPAPEAIEIDSPLALSVGDSLQVRPALLPEGSVGGMTFSVSDPDVAAVSPQGELLAVSEGNALLTVETFNGRTLTCPVEVGPEPQYITLGRNSVTLGVGEQARLHPGLEPEDARSAFTYASSAKKTASVDADGVITGLKSGTATITISTYNGKREAVKVTVKKAPGQVTLSDSELVLGWDEAQGLGESALLTARFSSGSAGRYAFSSSDPSVARVDDASGEVTAVGLGEAEIRVTAYNGEVAVCAVRVLAAPEAVRLDAAELTLGAGQTEALAAETEGGFARIGFESSDERVVTVSDSGALQARKPGTARVTARTFNGASASAEITVLRAPSKLSLGKASATIGVGGQFQLAPVIPENTAAGFTYVSSKPTVASVGEDGLVTGLRAGTATITVRTHNGRRNTVSVKVVKAPSRIAFNRSELSMQPTETQILKASLNSGSAANITYSSSDETVAVVDSAGRVEALEMGECVITAVTHNGLTAECVVRVEEGPAAIRVPADMTLGTSERLTPEIELIGGDGDLYDGEYTLISSNSRVVAVSGATIRGVRRGTAVITARSHTVTATFEVTVVRYSSLHPTMIFAHRGASEYVQNNTIEAFRLADEMGADGVELDVRRSRDGALVVFHDAALDVNGRRRAIADMTLAEIQEIELNGCHIPTLAEALDYIRGTDMWVQVELKAEGVGGDCADAVRRRGMGDRVIFISFSLSELSAARYEDPTARLGYLFNTLTFDIERLAQQYELYALLPRQAIVNEKMVNMAHSAGLKVGTWTVNDAETVASLAQIGVDYINTDRPDMARQNLP